MTKYFEKLQKDNFKLPTQLPHSITDTMTDTITTRSPRHFSGKRQDLNEWR